MMIHKLRLENILFLDIETVPETAHFSDLKPDVKHFWETKSRYQRDPDVTAETFYKRAGIWAEFGKIICISVGYFNIENKIKSFRVTSFYGDEATLLLDFKNLLETYFNKKQHRLCAHNGKEFDFPYIARRMIINGINLPNKLDLFGKKPWEVPHLDTLELWKFGDYKTYTSLALLSHVLQVPTPKDDIDGRQVYSVFYEEGNIDRIVTYCEKDTITVAQILLRLRGETLLKPEAIKHV